MKTETLFTSDLLTKGTALTISAHAMLVVTKGNIRALLKEVVHREKKNENPTSWIDNDITRWFENQTMPAIYDPFDSTIYRFTKTLSHESILDEAKRTGIYKIHTYTEALAITIKGILAGEVDEKGTGIVVYFQVDGNERLYRFRAWRRGGGQLSVIVGKVILDRRFGAGGGACFSNN